MKIILSILVATTLLSGCSTQLHSGRDTFYVSIHPLRSIVENIVGSDFEIKVLVPAGASPETFEPTPRQFIALNNARLVFNVGLIDFEQALLAKTNDTARIVNLSRGINLIAGSCSHNDGNHSHGVDPHVWTSPRELKTLAANAYEAIRRAYPDSTKYTDRYKILEKRLEQLDAETNERIARSGISSFIIYHPALTYYARAYGMEQIAIENEGKEPSAKRLSQIIRRAEEEGIKRVFYQVQFPVSAVEIISRDIGGTSVGIDPLQEDIFGNIMEITDLIIGK